MDGFVEVGVYVGFDEVFLIVFYGVGGEGDNDDVVVVGFF